MFFFNNFFVIKYLFWVLSNFFYCSISSFDACLKLFLSKKMLIGISLLFKYNSIFQCVCNVDIVAIDLLGLVKSNFRFLVCYETLSLSLNKRFKFQVLLNENSFLYSLSFIYNSVEWVEREIWDMFGIYFIGHFDLRRILTDYGFTNFPLRKDFPVTGFNEIFYDDSSQSTVFEKVEFLQDYRFIINRTIY